MGLQIQVLKASTRSEIEAAFATLARDRAESLHVAGDVFFTSRRHRWLLTREALAVITQGLSANNMPRRIPVRSRTSKAPAVLPTADLTYGRSED
jgi:hypothetical protein